MTLIEAIGWAALAFGGAYWAGALAFIVVGIRGGLEALPTAFYAAGITAVAWLAFVAWLSPLTIGVAP